MRHLSTAILSRANNGNRAGALPPSLAPVLRLIAPVWSVDGVLLIIVRSSLLTLCGVVVPRRGLLFYCHSPILVKSAALGCYHRCINSPFQCRHLPPHTLCFLPFGGLKAITCQVLQIFPPAPPDGPAVVGNACGHANHSISSGSHPSRSATSVSNLSISIITP